MGCDFRSMTPEGCGWVLVMVDGSVLVNFMCQLDLAKGGQIFGQPFALGVSVRVFLDETGI